MPRLTLSPERGRTRITPVYRYEDFQFGDGYEQVQARGINILDHYLVDTEFVLTDSTHNIHRSPLSTALNFLTEVRSDVPFDFDCPGLGDMMFRCLSTNLQTREQDFEFSLSVNLKSWRQASVIRTVTEIPAVADPLNIPIAGANASAPFTIPLRAGGTTPIVAATAGPTAAVQTLVLQLKRDTGWVNTGASVPTSTTLATYWSSDVLAPHISAGAGHTNAYRLKFLGTNTDTVSGGVIFTFN